MFARKKAVSGFCFFGPAPTPGFDKLSFGGVALSGIVCSKVAELPLRSLRRIHEDKSWIVVSQVSDA